MSILYSKPRKFQTAGVLAQTDEDIRKRKATDMVNSWRTSEDPEIQSRWKNMEANRMNMADHIAGIAESNQGQEIAGGYVNNYGSKYTEGIRRNPLAHRMLTDGTKHMQTYRDLSQEDKSKYHNQNEYRDDDYYLKKSGYDTEKLSNYMTKNFRPAKGPGGYVPTPEGRKTWRESKSYAYPEANYTPRPQNTW